MDKNENLDLNWIEIVLLTPESMTFFCMDILRKKRKIILGGVCSFKYWKLEQNVLQSNTAKWKKMGEKNVILTTYHNFFRNLKSTDKNESSLLEDDWVCSIFLLCSCYSFQWLLQIDFFLNHLYPTIWMQIVPMNNQPVLFM